MAVEIRQESLGSAAAGELIASLNAELSARYPEPGANHFRLDPAEVAAGKGAFLILYVDGAAVACAALRRLGAAEAEIKRMYVLPAYRRQGLARRLLMALERQARAFGCTRLVLETGERQREAVALYRQAGFETVPAWGEYLASPLSLCLGKSL